jgi:hypothetical protein
MSNAVTSLIAVSNRCLIEPASRALDAAIYCAVLGVTDANPLSSALLMEVRARGFILIHHSPRKAWADAPPYTEDLGCAKSLVPEGLSTIALDPRIVCATALMVRAIIGSPPVPLSGWVKQWLA